LTLHQIECFAIVAGMLALFVSDRLRCDVAAALALSCAAFAGIVPREKVFEGFSNIAVQIMSADDTEPTILTLTRSTRPGD
jgi:di/tricarboxylate transporter